MKVICVDETDELTLDQIKWLESKCRRERKRIKNGGNKDTKTIDMFDEKEE